MSLFYILLHVYINMLSCRVAHLIAANNLRAHVDNSRKMVSGQHCLHLSFQVLPTIQLDLRIHLLVVFKAIDRRMSGLCAASSAGS